MLQPPEIVATPVPAARRQLSGETLAALALTVLAVALHCVRLASAGALWRDEAAAVNLATAPSLAEVWAGLDFEVMPLLPPLVVRAWAATGWGATDFGLRVLGFLVGLSIVAALWWAAGVMSGRPPTLALALVALSPVVIVWGDEVRPYGLAMLLGIVAVGAVWRLVELPSAGRAVVAELAALLAVQAAYAGVFAVLGACASGAVVALRQRRPRRSLGMVAVGLVAAASLLPYAGHWRNIAHWGDLVRVPVTAGQLLRRAFAALDAAPAVGWLWIAAAILALAGREKADIHLFRAAKKLNVRFFATATLAMGAVGFFAWLKLSAYQPYDWHFLPWMAPAALCLDVALAAGTGPVRQARRWLAVVAALAVLVPAWGQARARQTDVDLVAAKLAREAHRDDVVVVVSWLQISFRRYYDGPATVVEMPPVGPLAVHRYDRLQQLMASGDPMRPVRESVAARLRAGRRVWVVGEQPLPRSGEGAIAKDGAFTIRCLEELANILQTRALRARPVWDSHARRVNPYEAVTLSVAEGWR